MNFNTLRQRGSARIAVIAGVVALVILGSIAYANRTQTATTPPEARPVEQAPATEYRSPHPPISPTAETNDNVKEYD